MNRTNSILFKAVKGDENSITELLCNLMRYRFLRELVLEEMGIDQNVISKINFDDIETQKKISDIGIPDIRISNESVEILIEVKTTTQRGFEDNQLINYPRFLNESHKPYRKLVFLIPESNMHKSELKDLLVDHKTLITVLTWEMLIQKFNDLDISTGNSIISEIINFISLKVQNKSAQLLFSTEEIAMLNNPKDLIIANQLFFKFDDVIKQSKDKIIESLSKMIPTQSWNNTSTVSTECYGRGLWINDIYIGFSFFIEDPNYLFSLAFPMKSYREPVKYEYISDEEFYYIKYSKYVLTGADCIEDFINETVDTISNIHTKYYYD